MKFPAKFTGVCGIRLFQDFRKLPSPITQEPCVYSMEIKCGEETCTDFLIDSANNIQFQGKFVQNFP